MKGKKPDEDVFLKIINPVPPEEMRKHTPPGQLSSRINPLNLADREIANLAISIFLPPNSKRDNVSR